MSKINLGAVPLKSIWQRSPSFHLQHFVKGITIDAPFFHDRRRTTSFLLSSVIFFLEINVHDKLKTSETRNYKFHKHTPLVPLRNDMVLFKIFLSKHTPLVPLRNDMVLFKIFLSKHTPLVPLRNDMNFLMSLICPCRS